MTITISDIQQIVGERFFVTKPEMLGPRRGRRIARPRQIAMALCREHTGATLPRIGGRFGGRDHTTVLHAIRRVEALEAQEPGFRRTMEVLRAAVVAHVTSDAGEAAEREFASMCPDEWHTANSGGVE